MDYGDIVSSFLFETKEAAYFSDRGSSGSEGSSDEEDNGGIISSLFGFMGFGAKTNQNKRSSNRNLKEYKAAEVSKDTFKTNNANVLDNQNIHVVRVKTVKHNGVEINKTKEVRTFALNSFPLFHQVQKTEDDTYDLNSSFTESNLSYWDTSQKPGIKLKLKGGPHDYVIPSKPPVNKPQNLLTARLFVKTLENVVSKRMTSYSSYFLSQLKIEHINSTSEAHFERRLSFNKILKNSFKNQPKRLTIPRKYSVNENTNASTRASTIFGNKELNMIYHNNSLECLPEGDSICTDESLLNPSKARMDVKDGLSRLHKLFEKKHYGFKIHALYRIVWNKSQEAMNISNFKMEKMNSNFANKNFERYVKQPLTARHRRDKKSVAHEISELDDQSENDFAFRTIKWSTKSEFGSFEEEEQIYLCSEYDDSIDIDNHDSFSVEIGHLLNEETKTLKGENWYFEESSNADHDESNWLEKMSSIGSEDVQKEAKISRKISMNAKDIDTMTKQLAEIRKLIS